MGSFETGKYRNLFKEIGKTDAEIENKIKEAVETFFYDENERIYHEAGEDMGYLTDTGINDARTEGMSYGMMMCVQLDMKEEFDRIWKWSKTYMYMSEGENEGYFAWSCALDCKKNNVQLVFSHVNEQPMTTMEKDGFVDLVGRENFQPHINDALKRAAEI